MKTKKKLAEQTRYMITGDGGPNSICVEADAIGYAKPPRMSLTKRQSHAIPSIKLRIPKVASGVDATKYDYTKSK